jgi:type II secretory pathway predicted ATPase ExeA
MVYLEHFGLREAPFGITPHTEFFFSGANRGATLEALIYAVTHDEGIVEVSGEVGSGKTMLCRMLLERLPEDVATVYLAMPSLSPEDILRAVADELEIALAPDARPHEMMRALQERLLEIHAAGRRVVAMIDEAHAMPAETLEEIRLLSNLESSRHKLLHIVLFGQPELDERLAEKDLRQLKDRVTQRFALEPLPRGDVGAYLAFRLHAAGYNGPELFTPPAVRLIARESRGLSRRINVLADKCLLAAFAEGRRVVDTPQARAAIRDARFPPTDADRRRILAVSGVVLAAAAFGGLALWRGAPPPEKPPAVEPARPALPAPATLAERIAATDAWLKNTPGSHYFVQFLSVEASKLADVRILVDELSARLDPAQIRVYRSRLSGIERLGVIYGDYPTREAAQAELPELSRLTPAAKPWVRSVSKLR